MRRRLIDPSDTGLVIALSLQQSVAGWSHTGCMERARRVRTCVSRYACRRRFIKLGIVDKTPAGGRLIEPFVPPVRIQHARERAHGIAVRHTLSVAPAREPEACNDTTCVYTGTGVPKQTNQGWWAGAQESHRRWSRSVSALTRRKASACAVTGLSQTDSDFLVPLP